MSSGTQIQIDEIEFCLDTASSQSKYKLYIKNPSQYHKPAVAIAIVRGPPQGFDLLMRGSENGSRWEFPKESCFLDIGLQNCSFLLL